MAKVRPNSSEPKREIRPAIDPEIRELQMISLAVDLAEKQLMDGTASSQVITHYLKLGSSKELITAKTESIKSQKRVEELYAEALKAMRIYNGQGMPEDYEDRDDDDD